MLDEKLQGTRPSGPPRKREKPVRLGSAVVARRLAAMISRRPGPCLQKAAIQWEIMGFVKWTMTRLDLLAADT